MVRKNRTSIDCACVIHGNAYDWTYVDRLYNMINRNMDSNIRFHVYTESDRPVPDYMIKHNLINWPDANKHKRGWWYKMQLFNAEQFDGDLLYFDLDVVIIDKLDWIVELPTSKFWAIRDFKYLQNKNLYQINSSVMWWNVSQFDWVWQKFKSSDMDSEMRLHQGDQDYIDSTIGQNQIQYFPVEKIISWRWESYNGGITFHNRAEKQPGAGTITTKDTSVLVFHGQPKPHEMLDDVVVKQHWN